MADIEFERPEAIKAYQEGLLAEALKYLSEHSKYYLYVHFAPGLNMPKPAPRLTVRPRPALLPHIIEGNHSPEHLELCLYALLLGILAELPEGEEPASRGMLDPRLQNALALIDTRPKPECTNARLAKAVNMATSSFQRLFQQQIGVSPQQYVTHIHMDQARLLLSSTDLPISEIAERLGFANRYHFTAVFTRCNDGMPPAAYRRQCAR